MRMQSRGLCTSSKKAQSRREPASLDRITSSTSGGRSDKLTDEAETTLPTADLAMMERSPSPRRSLMGISINAATRAAIEQAHTLLN